MKYYSKCNSVFNSSKVLIVGEDETHYFTITHAKLPIIQGLKIFDEVNNLSYKINYNPLKFKKRFQMLDSNNVEVMGISVGLKYLHKIEYKNKVYSCKGNIWKIKYVLYDVDEVIATIKVVKINKERYFEIELKDNKNIMIALAMLVITQSIRERLFII